MAVICGYMKDTFAGSIGDAIRALKHDYID